MNIEELKKVLDKEGIKPIYYSLNGIRGDKKMELLFLKRKATNGCTIIMSGVVNLTFNILIQKMKLVNIYFKY